MSIYIYMLQASFRSRISLKASAVAQWRILAEAKCREDKDIVLIFNVKCLKSFM